MGDVQGNRLLIIDDDAAFGQLIQRAAEGAGFEAVAVEDHCAFRHALRAWSPNVIMLDLQLPGRDGVELLRELTTDKCTAQIIISSGLDAKVLESVVRLGAERGLRMIGALQKPVRIEDLRQMLSRHKPVEAALSPQELADAIATDQLLLEYQPKLDCHAGRVVGVEALVRWQHPQRGLIYPDRFIGLAEGTDLIHDLTDWVIGAAARQAQTWQGQGLDLNVAVNVSARNLEHLDLPDRFAERCAQFGMRPETLSLELTETGAMRDPVQMMDVLTRLRVKGFELSIDDFGTGYSSLVQLQRMPFSELKIDRSFVMQMQKDKDARVITEIICDLARKLHLKSVAEGVENKDTLAALLDMGCNVVQGYHLSRPIPADQIVRFVHDHTASIAKAAA